MSSHPRLTPVAILTGFLGSGKTTLLQHVLASPAMKRTAIIINEFGEVSIDHLLVANSTDNIIELRNGCLCCTIRGDLAMTLRDLYEKRLLEEIPPFDYVIIETTGIADPVPILHTLITNQPLRTAYFPDAVITCVDALHGLRTLQEHDCARSQCAIADVVLVTKTDLVAAADVAAVREAIVQLNPQAELRESVAGQVEHELLFGRHLFEPYPSAEKIRCWLELGDSAPASHAHGHYYRTHLLASPDPLSMAGVSVFLNHLVNESKDDVLRIKGIVAARERGGRPAVVHGVREKFYPIQWLDAWPSEDHSSRLVLIGKSLDSAHLDECFARLCVQ